MSLYHTSHPSPLGALDVYSTPKGVCALQPGDHRARSGAHLVRHVDAKVVEPGDPFGATERLRRYFEGDLAAFDDLVLDLHGTAFQLDVWRLLRAIPAGTTTSYGVLARAIGRPQASRAVGMANARNPVMIVVACHRVIGASGALTGYAGGLDRKAWLLRHERAPAARQLELEHAAGC